MSFFMILNSPVQNNFVFGPNCTDMKIKTVFKRSLNKVAVALCQPAELLADFDTTGLCKKGYSSISFRSHRLKKQNKMRCLSRWDQGKRTQTRITWNLTWLSKHHSNGPKYHQSCSQPPAQTSEHCHCLEDALRETSRILLSISLKRMEVSSPVWGLHQSLGGSCHLQQVTE